MAPPGYRKTRTVPNPPTFKEGRAGLTLSRQMRVRDSPRRLPITACGPDQQEPSAGAARRRPAGLRIHCSSARLDDAARLTSPGVHQAVMSVGDCGHLPQPCHEPGSSRAPSSG